MSRSPHLPRRAVLLASAALAVSPGAPATAAAVAGRSRLDEAMAATLAAHSLAIHREMALEDCPGHAAAVAVSEAWTTRLDQLAEQLVRQPIRSLADCVTFARFIEYAEDLPREDEIRRWQVRDRALPALVLGLLRIGNAPRYYEHPARAGSVTS